MNLGGILKLYHLLGNHFGIPQGKSKWLKTATPNQQIMWGIKYNNNRYGSMCKALEHYKLKGWH